MKWLPALASAVLILFGIAVLVLWLAFTQVVRPYELSGVLP